LHAHLAVKVDAASSMLRIRLSLTGVNPAPVDAWHAGGKCGYSPVVPPRSLMPLQLCSRLVRALPLIVAASLFALPVGVRAQDHAHVPPPAAHFVPADRGDARWATDAPLRDGMRRVRQAAQALEHAEHGHLDAAQTANVAKLIDGAVNDMITNCKLDPDADAALHGLLAKFLVGANAARTGKDIPAALADMQAALKRYPLLFDDPTWDVPAD
jgi:hypothetical protein